MATTTTNFGFDIPQSTDLVKDGATSIATLGQDVDTFLFNTQKMSGGRNKIINGAFDWWQRGTTFTNPTSSATAYSADRWQSFRAGFQTGITTTRQSASLTGFQYCLRQQRNSGNTATDIMYLLHNLETDNSIPLAGQTVTLSFYVRRGSNNLGSSNSVAVLLASGTGTNQNLITTGSYTGNVNLVNTNFTATTSWQRFTYTATVGTTATQLGVRFAYTPTGTAGANEYLEVTGVQLEISSVATPFTTASGSIGGELALCQRYYWRFNASSTYSPFAVGISASTTQSQIYVNFPTTMRIAPTIVDWANLCISDLVNYNLAVNVAGITIPNSTVGVAELQVGHANGATALRPAFLRANNSTDGYLGLNAEL